MLALAKNPLWLRDWRASSRLVRTPWMLAATGLGMTTVLLLVAMNERELPPATLGRMLFQIYFTVTGAVTLLFGPAIAANAIALEREGKTWEALVMAGLTPRVIDRGKFLGSYTYLALFLFSLLPAAAVPHLFGGVTIAETLLGVAMSFALGAIAVRVGLWVSAALPSTRVALLATVGATGVMGVMGTSIIVGGGRSLRNLGMHSIQSDAPAFWPVALVREHIGFDYIRYLVIIPMLGLLAGWFGLRALTIASLTSSGPRRGAELRRAYLRIMPLVIAVLALAPGATWDGIVVAQLIYSAITVWAALTLTCDRALFANAGPGVNAQTTTLLMLGSLFGWVAIPVGAHFCNSWDDSYYGRSARDAAFALLAYGPAFLLFIIGLAAAFRAKHANPVYVRVAVGAIAGLAVLFPAFVAVMSRAATGSRELAPLAFSPIGIFEADRLAPLLFVAIAGYAVVGGSLLVRGQRALARSIQSR